MFHDYTLALLVFALFVKVILLPLGLKQHSNQLKQAKIRPLEAAIVKKYNGKNDRASQQKKQMELQTVQQKAGYSQFAGCLPLIIQLPIVLLIYNVIRNPLSYIVGYGKKTIDGIKAIAVGAADEISMLGKMHANPEAYLGVEGIGADTVEALVAKLPNFNFFFGMGPNLAATPSFTSILVLIPILTFVFTFLSSKIMRKLSYQSPSVAQTNADGDTKLSLAIMDFVMPALSTWITFSVPGVIGIYWIYQSLLGVLQQLIMVKARPFPKFTEDDYKEAERAILGKKKKNKRGMNAGKDPNRPRVPSLHHIDDDEYNAKVVVPKENKPKDKKSGMLDAGSLKSYDD
jgi:YidC/Oxa1 family membrane protein insertase